MKRFRLTLLRAVAFVVAVLALSYPATWVAWTGWPWSTLRFAAIVLALWAMATFASRVTMGTAAVVLVLLCPPVGIRVADKPEWSKTPASRLVGPAIGAHETVHRHGIPVGWVWFSTRDKAYLNGELDYPDKDLVATEVMLLPWPSIRREAVMGLGGNIIDNWDEHPQLRRDASRLIVASTRYYNGHMHWWDQRRIGLGPTVDVLTLPAWIVFALLLARRFLRVPAREQPAGGG